jgi:alcohol dehydrogenase (cytochrome c)
MQGVTGSHHGGGYIVGLDAETGSNLWKFNTIAQPGDPLESSWNGVPVEKRTGGGVWTAGSYDAEQGLAFFGPAPTYDTEPLRKRVSQSGITNDALYTNATVALDVQTGRLVWYHQHLANDQWDLDWAFERQLIELPVNGKMRKLIVTAGKEAIYDAIDRETGRYVFSLDLGLQNLVTSIDARTGAKTVDPNLIPGDGKVVTVCPHAAGAKSWLPASYDPTGHILYAPLVESCMDLIPTRKGHGMLTSDVRWTLRPRPDSDGKYGRLEAIDLGARLVVWTMRQRAPQTTGVLATAGGIVFAGALDRWFSAYSADTGASLWKIRLGDAPYAAPVTYIASGRQYVAVVVGSGYGQSETFLPLVPEIRPPVTPNSTLWVFELPQ